MGKKIHVWHPRKIKVDGVFYVLHRDGPNSVRAYMRTPHGELRRVKSRDLTMQLLRLIRSQDEAKEINAASAAAAAARSRAEKCEGFRAAETPDEGPADVCASCGGPERYHRSPEEATP